jgi:hypothetical protein
MGKSRFRLLHDGCNKGVLGKFLVMTRRGCSVKEVSYIAKRRKVDTSKYLSVTAPIYYDFIHGLCTRP